MRHNITLQRPFTHRSTSNPRRFSGQSAAQADSLAYSHTGLLRAYPDHRPRRADSLTCSPPDPCAPPDNQLPRTDPLACSFTGPLCASSPTDYPGIQVLVAGRQHLIAPDHSACRRPGSARHRGSPDQLRNAPAHPSYVHIPAHHLSPLLRREVMWGHPHVSASSSIQLSRTSISFFASHRPFSGTQLVGVIKQATPAR